MKILIIEDDFRLSEIIKQGLEEQGYQVIVAFDGEMGKKTALSQDISLLISDIILPKLNGLEVCKAIRKIKPQIPVIMLTALGSTDDKIEGFDAGADDYLVKPFELRELYARIKALLKRTDLKSGPTERLLQYADIEMHLDTKTVKRNQTDINLTPREFSLLGYFLRNPEVVLSRDQIAVNVWETHIDTGTNFIDVYMNYLRKKIDKPFASKLIHTKPGMGFILKQE